MLAQTGNRKRSSGRRGERTNAGGRDRNYSGPSEEREREHEGATGRQNEQLDPGSYCLFVFVCVYGGTVITAVRSSISMYMCIRVCVWI